MPVNPLGQVCEPPPKQRGIPERSSLQTSFFPSQQFCDALIITVPPSGSGAVPQMLPTPLQAWPLSHRPLEHCTEPLGFIPPPQHALSLVHEVPVSRHPPAGMQTVAPAPGSKQVREQQFDPPLQGLPS
jgi:hypothetical protein